METTQTQTVPVKKIEPGTTIDGRMLGRRTGLTATEGTQIVKDKDTGKLFLQHPLVTTEQDADTGSIRRLAAPTGIDAIDAASASYLALFQSVLGGGAGGLTTELVMDVPIDGKSMVIPAMQGMPRIRKWVGPRQFQNPRAYAVTYPIARYEVTTRIQRIEVDYDKTGVYTQWLEMFLRGAARSIDDLVITNYLNNTWLCYDSTAFLSASHPNTNSTGNNLTTNPLSPTQYDSTRQALELWTDEYGTIANTDFTDLVLVGGPKSRRTIKEITKGNIRLQPVTATGALDTTSSNVAAVGIENAYLNDAQGMVISWISGRQWFLTSRAAGMRPFVMGVARPLTPVIQIAMDGEARVMLDEYRYGMDGDLAFAPGPPFLTGGSVTA